MIYELSEELRRLQNLSRGLPFRCVDSVLKCCNYCQYGYTIYPEWVETYEDTFDCPFECGCSLGYDKGFYLDSPTEEEEMEFEEWRNLVK